MKKIILLLFLLLFPFIWYAYNSSEIINLSFTNINNLTKVYTVPVWKDLLIKEVTVSSDTVSLVISDNWIDIISNLTGFFSYNTNIIIENDLYIKQNPNTNNIYYNFYWVLIDENIDIENIVNNSDNGFNKNIFSYEWLQEIYLYEFIILLIIYIIVFFEKVLWRKNYFMRK